jgi:hypothetical protein
MKLVLGKVCITGKNYLLYFQQQGRSAFKLFLQYFLNEQNDFYSLDFLKIKNSAIYCFTVFKFPSGFIA